MKGLCQCVSVLLLSNHFTQALLLRGYQKGGATVLHSHQKGEETTAPQWSRRAALSTLASLTVLPSATQAALPSTDLVDIYFGVGCFWHVQHEFIEAERKILNRGEAELTSLAGYAGGTKKGKTPPQIGANGAVTTEAVCYHNLQGIADYGKLGHGEVVGMRVPAENVGAFAEVYFGLFDDKGDRPDKGDRGLEYRSLLGLPGGMNSPLFSQVADACARRKQGGASVVQLDLVEGVGNDSDTLAKHKAPHSALPHFLLPSPLLVHDSFSPATTTFNNHPSQVWVMDSAKFPFFKGEVYHQFHDGFFPGEDYPRAYNDLRDRAVAQGRLTGTACPDIV